MGFTFIGFFIDSNWPYYVAFAVGTAALISDYMANLIIKVWFGLAHILGYINSRILLSVIYYLILVPFALIGKLSKNQALNLSKNQKSYYTNRNHKFKPADFEKPW